MPDEIDDKSAPSLEPSEVPASAQDSGVAMPASTENSGENVAPMETPAVETPQASAETPQIPVNEALTPEGEQPKVELEKPPKAETKPTNPPQPRPVPAPPRAPVPNINRARELWTKALDAIQGRKRKRLEKIITLFDKHAEITNDMVEKLLHVSDATASRYLSQLEKEGKIKQNSPTGRGVSYSKI